MAKRMDFPLRLNCAHGNLMDKWLSPYERVTKLYVALQVVTDIVKHNAEMTPAMTGQVCDVLLAAAELMGSGKLPDGKEPWRGHNRN